MSVQWTDLSVFDSCSVTATAKESRSSQNASGRPHPAGGGHPRGPRGAAHPADRGVELGPRRAWTAGTRRQPGQVGHTCHSNNRMSGP